MKGIINNGQEKYKNRTAYKGYIYKSADDQEIKRYNRYRADKYSKS